MTVTVRFRQAAGRGECVIAAADGARLLDVAQTAGQPLEGTCGGQMACATCHVIVDPADLPKLPPPSEAEECLLDLVLGATRTSRLACQVRLDGFDALSVCVPG